MRLRWQKCGRPVPQTGEIHYLAGATGIDSVKGVTAKSMSDPSAIEDTAYGSLIAPGRVASTPEIQCADGGGATKSNSSNAVTDDGISASASKSSLSTGIRTSSAVIPDRSA